MELDSTRTDILVQHAEYIASPGTREAFAYPVGSAALSPNWIYHAQMKGDIRDFRLHDSAGSQPFSLIVNRDSLLFYFRPPAVRSGRYFLVDLERSFEEVRENNSGEWTVRITSLESARRLWAYINSTSEFSSGDGKTTQIGYVNLNNQRCHGHRGFPGNDHLPKAYRMECLNEGCGHTYGANGSDVFQRKCPRCQGGAPGIEF